jgi:hypothetical protein
MYIMLNYNYIQRSHTYTPLHSCRVSRSWHPANILEPDLALAINSLARPVDQIIGLHRLLTLIVSLPVSNPNAGLRASGKMTLTVISAHMTPAFPHELLGRLIVL